MKVPKRVFLHFLEGSRGKPLVVNCDGKGCGWCNDKVALMCAGGSFKTSARVEYEKVNK